MAIDVGDAVLKFLGDTTQLDATFDSIGDKAEKGLQPATEALDGVSDGFEKAGESAQEAGGEMADAGKVSGQSLRNARGEAALLGEEFGIRLPRHVRSFIAELPGVGVALNAAFSATAILFIVQALIQAEEKLRVFLSHQKEHEEQKRILDEEAKAVGELGKEAARAGEELDKLVKTPVQLLQSKIAALTAEYEHLYLATYTPQDVLAAKGKALEEEIALAKQQLELEEKKNKETSNAKTLENINKEIELRKKLSDVQATFLEAVKGMSKENADEIRYQASLKALQAQARAETQYGKDSVEKVKDINAEIEKLEVDHGLKVKEELDKEKLAYEKNLEDLGKSLVTHTEELTIAQTVQEARMHELADAAAKLGITLRSDLALAYQRAVAAQKELISSGIATQAEIKAGEKALEEAKEKLDEYGQSIDKFKLKSKGMWAEFRREAEGGASAMDLVKQSGVQAFDDLSKNIQGAFSSIVLGEGNIAKALEKATAASLASIASQAAVKALFYTAEGFAALAVSNAGSAANYFTAAGEMAAVAGAAGVAGRALSGASGGSGSGGSVGNPNGGGNGKNNFSFDTSVSNTGSQASSGRSNFAVQGFANGGLITAPTLAMIGEGGGREAAIPLDNPQAMDIIGKAVAGAIAVHGGGGVHIHLPHGSIISADVMQKFVAKMNKMVGKGQLRVQASDSHKLTRRGA